MNFYQTMVIKLRKNVDNESFYANETVCYAIELLGENTFNTHMKSILDYIFSEMKKNNITINEKSFVDNCSGAFCSAFRQWDVCDHYPRSLTTIRYNLMDTHDIYEQTVSINGVVDMLMRSAIQLPNSTFWEIFGRLTTKYLNEVLLQSGA